MRKKKKPDGGEENPRLKPWHQNAGLPSAVRYAWLPGSLPDVSTELGNCRDPSSSPRAIKEFPPTYTPSCVLTPHCFTYRRTKG